MIALTPEEAAASMTTNAKRIYIGELTHMK